MSKSKHKAWVRAEKSDLPTDAERDAVPAREPIGDMRGAELGLLEWPMVKIHVCEGGLRYEFNFDATAPRAWCPLVTIWVEECARKVLTKAETIAAIAGAFAALRPAYDAHTRAAIAVGEPSVNEAGAMGIMGIGATMIQEYRRAGKIPEPVLGLNGRNLWLKSDLEAARMALFMNAGFEKSRGAGTKRRAPDNRYVATMRTK